MKLKKEKKTSPFGLKSNSKQKMCPALAYADTD